MVILGLDQSTKNTGWSIFENRKLIAYDKIAISDKYNISKRMEMMILKIREIILKYNPDKVYFEQTFSKGNPKSFRALCQLQGLLIWELYLHKIPYTIVEESTWAKNISCCYGKRDERKSITISKMNQMFNINLNDNDIADAIAIGWYGACKEKVD